MSRDPGLRKLLRLACGAALGLAAHGCASTQSVPLDCVEEQIAVYVDGRLLEGDPDEIRLRTDQPHKLYFKREGSEPQLVVLEPTTGPDGERRLEPANVCVKLVPVGLGREITIEVEEDEAP